MPHSKRLCNTLSKHLVSGHLQVAEQVATCFGNLSTHPTFRKEMVDGSKALLALLQLLPEVKPIASGSNEQL